MAVLIGGISLYRSFAMYEEQQTFNVLNGTVPTFVYGDIKLAVKVNGQTQKEIPTPKENYVVSITCDNNVNIEWDYEKWGPNIEELTKEAKCSLDFLSNNDIKTLGKLIGVTNLSVDTIPTNIEALVKSKEGMTYLARSPKLIESLQKASGYNDEIKKKILNSTAVSENMKYEAGLPCYIYQRTSSNNIVEHIRQYCFATGETAGASAICHEQSYNNKMSYSLNLQNSSIIGTSSNKIDVSKYTKLEVDYDNLTNDSNAKLIGTFQFGLSTDAVKDDSNANFVVNSTGYSFTNNISKNKVESINITNQNQSFYFRFKITHGTEIKYNSIFIALNSVALY